jgi:hypothetical protein
MLVVHRRTCVWALALTLYGSGARAEPDAATRAAARQLAEDGVSALQNGDAATAVQKLEKAHHALQAPSVALWSARALVKQGLLVEARERYIEATRLLVSAGDKAVQEQAKIEAQTESEQLSARIPSLRISVAGAAGGQGVQVSVDGRELPELLLGEDRPTNPGSHQIVAQRGAEEAKESLTLAEGEHRRVELKLGVVVSGVPTAEPDAAAPAISKPGGTVKTLGFVALIAGGAGLVTGGVTGLLAMSKRNALDDDARCHSGQCLYSAEGDVGSLRTFRTISTVGFVAGGVLAAAGVALLLTAPGESEQSARVSLNVGPASVGVRGTF